jgi:hypothetical protein
LIEEINGEPSLRERWSAWGINRPLDWRYAEAWEDRFWYLLPDSLELGGEDNYLYFPQGPTRDRVRSAITRLLVGGTPDKRLIAKCRNYWLGKGYVVAPHNDAAFGFIELQAAPTGEGSHA